MVEINKMLRKTYLYLFAACVCAVGVFAQQPGARIAGLENNAEYLQLLREDAQLQNREDSVVNAVERVRQLLRESPTSRQQYSQEILRLENMIFGIRTAKGRVVDRINTIEQEWVFSNLTDPGQTQVTVNEASSAMIPDSLKRRNLIDNPCFAQHLDAADYKALRRAQQLEMQAVDYVNRYFANHAALSDLAAAYAVVNTEPEAVDIYSRYTALRGMNEVLADSLAQTWNYVFDNKSYAYGYLMDMLGCDEVLTREEERVAEAVRQLAALRGETASDAVADYFLRKQAAVDYEIAVAGALSLDAARDSLRGVAAQLKAIDFRLPKVEVAQRSFLEYEPLEFFAASPYTYQNPIPECRIYALGRIYRVLLGTFNTKRAAAVFRGAFPLCYQIDADGKWNYYAGGFATREEAEAAQKKLKARGFVRPEVVVWHDGQMRNLTRDPEAAMAACRVEISGAETLSEGVKQILQTLAADKELSRVGQQLFVVGVFDDPAVAEQLAETLRQAAPSLEIKVAGIAE